MAGLMKDFFDRTNYPALDRINGRPYATVICAGSDGHNAARQVERIATGWRLKAVADPLIVCTHAQTPETILAPKVVGPDDLRCCEEPGGRPRSRDEPRGVLAGPEQVSIGADIPCCEESGWAERGNGLLPLMGGAGAAFERTALFQDDLPEGRERMGH
jgi:hypothetical protein